MNDYIYCNNKIFYITDRQVDSAWHGGDWERAIDGTGWIDHVAIKKEFSFTFYCDNDRELARLYTIFQLTTTITLIDADSVSYSVALTSKSFSPKYNKDGSWIVSLEFKEV